MKSRATTIEPKLALELVENELETEESDEVDEMKAEETEAEDSDTSETAENGSSVEPTAEVERIGRIQLFPQRGMLRHWRFPAAGRGEPRGRPRRCKNAPFGGRGEPRVRPRRCRAHYVPERES